MAAIVWSMVTSQSDIHSTSAIVAGKMLRAEIVTSVSTCFLLMLCLFFLLKMADQASRGWFLIWYVLSVAFLILERFVILLWGSPSSDRSRLHQRVAVYGTAGLVERVIDNLTANDSHVVVTGVFSDEKAKPAKSRIAGGMQTLIESAQRGKCDHVVLALPSSANDKIHDALTRLEVLPISVQLCPDAMTVPNGTQNSKSGLVLIDLQHPPLSPREVVLKAAMDYMIGAIALVILAPVMAAIAIAIKRDSPGPVFFVQSRHGYNHRIIRVVKFRTMSVAEDGAHVIQAVRGDKRVTRIGRFLRRTSLDELPQLINVMQGELSLVGPRPHAVAHNEAYAQILRSYASRHKVKPGITGLAQVNGCRGETKTPEDMRRRVEFDLHYIKNWSPWLDLKIIVRTAMVPFFNSNAY